MGGIHNNKWPYQKEERRKVANKFYLQLLPNKHRGRRNQEVQLFVKNQNMIFFSGPLQKIAKVLPDSPESREKSTHPTAVLVPQSAWLVGGALTES